METELLLAVCSIRLQKIVFVETQPPKIVRSLDNINMMQRFPGDCETMDVCSKYRMVFRSCMENLLSAAPVDITVEGAALTRFKF